MEKEKKIKSVNYEIVGGPLTGVSVNPLSAVLKSKQKVETLQYSPPVSTFLFLQEK